MHRGPQPKLPYRCDTGGKNKKKLYEMERPVRKDTPDGRRSPWEPFVSLFNSRGVDTYKKFDF